jgi:alpha-galactosidase
MRSRGLCWLFSIVIAAGGPAARGAASSKHAVSVKRGQPIVIRTPRAEFEISAAGYWRSYLLQNGARLTLDRPGAADASDEVRIDGNAVGPFRIDYARVHVSDNAQGGKRVTIPAWAKGPNGAAVERTFAVETRAAFPGMLVSTVTYKNVGGAAFRLDQVTTQWHRLDASLADPKVRPYQLWSFQGSSSESNLDDVLELAPKFSRTNLMGATAPVGRGGGVPVVAFWTAKVGTAIGHLDPKPQTLSIPVQVADDGYPRAALVFDPQVTLRPGETYSTPPTFVMGYAGDYYEPVHTYSLALQKQGWKPARPTDEAYNVNWCGWGYGFNVTPSQMLGVIPKLKAMRINWATLDDRWFDAYGDWNPRQDTFPGDSIKRMVNEYHTNGMLVQIWWIPHAVETAGHKYSSHAYVDAKVAKEHPDWLVLDKTGKPALMIRQLAVLCPAMPEVQQYIRKVTEKFVRDWGFDGHKLDNVFTAPACYNPKHHHQSPYDSVYALGEIYRVVFENTREFKPASVTQICSCHTPANIVWLPYLDQTVTADPTGGPQVRRRIKLYKALLGGDAAVYGDHVEMTEYARKPEGRVYTGPDFASTVGTGGVVGTKFVWPAVETRERIGLTPEREEIWKRWISIYQARMLSRGQFENLYTYGYDVPEGYAVRKDGKMYYAFFAAYADARWQGEIELRGLGPGQYRIFDYVNNRELGTVDSRKPRLAVEFSGNLLIEASRR